MARIKRVPHGTTHAGTKTPTGIDGSGDIAPGGRPRGPAGLPAGGPGPGRTAFAMPFLACAARARDEPGGFATKRAAPTAR